MIKIFKGVIFDLDGTLIDSMTVWEDVDRRFLAGYGCIATREISDTVKTMSIRDSADFFIERFSLPATPEQVVTQIEKLVEDEYFTSIPAKPRAAELLEALTADGIRLCIATATYRRLAVAICERLGFSRYIDFLLTCSEVGESKTSPAIFHTCAEKMALAQSTVAVVEDSLHSVKTAVNAGFFTVAVYDEFSSPDWEEIKRTANAAVTDLGSLAKIITGKDAAI